MMLFFLLNGTFTPLLLTAGPQLLTAGSSALLASLNLWPLVAFAPAADTATPASSRTRTITRTLRKSRAVVGSGHQSCCPRGGGVWQGEGGPVRKGGPVGKGGPAGGGGCGRGRGAGDISSKSLKFRNLSQLSLIILSIFPLSVFDLYPDLGYQMDFLFRTNYKKEDSYFTLLNCCFSLCL